MKNYFLKTDTVMAAAVDTTVDDVATDDQVMELLNAPINSNIFTSPLIDFEYISTHKVTPRKIKIQFAPMNDHMHKIVLEDFIYKMESIPCQYYDVLGGCRGKMLWIKDREDHWTCRCTRHCPVNDPPYVIIHIDFECDSSGVFCQQTMVKGAKVS